MNRKQRRDADQAVQAKRETFAVQLPAPAPFGDLQDSISTPTNGQGGGAIGGGSTDAGGYGVGLPGAVPATGQAPRSNPFIIPKAAGLSVISQTFPSNFFVEWNTTTWRYACDQATRMGQALSYATLVTWAYQSSPFIQMLFQKLGDAIDETEFFITDRTGNRIDELSQEFCQKDWQMQLRKEILWSYMWGFTGINFDPIAGKVYKYPMQQIDPINRMLKGGTYDYFDGYNFSDHDNMLFVQPSTNDESFLGFMQPITRMFIMMNQTDNNWLSAGRRLAFPVMTVGYPQNSNSMTQDGHDINEFRLQAENIAANIDPSKGFVFPYTLDGKGEIQKSIEIDFAETKAGQNMYKIYSEFGDDKKNEIRELILGGTLSSSGSKSGSGSRSLGEVHERMFKQVVKSKLNFVLSILNNDYVPKLGKYYSGLPAGWKYDINRSEMLTIEEMGTLSTALNANGLRLNSQFFIANGINKDYIEEMPEPVPPKTSGKPTPDPDPDVNMARPSKKKFW